MGSPQVCVRCILTDKTPGIIFDGDGVCNFCKIHEPISLQPESKLREVLDVFRKKDKKWDCMVGLSGGRDSTYVLWKLVNDYQMKVLAVTYDNPFASEQARRNIERALRTLNVDGLRWGFPKDVHRKATGKYLRIWSRNPSSVLIPLVCAHCKSWWPGFFRIARENDIPLVVIGSNPLETASFKEAGFGGARTYHRLSKLPKVLTRTIKEVAANPQYLTTSWRMVLRMYLGASHSTPYLKWRYKDITVLRLFDYLKWDEKEVESTIARNLGWQKSPEVASSWRFDCRLDYVRRLMYSSTVGVTELRDLFSKMIREKQLTRVEALERIKREDLVPQVLVEQVLGEFDLRLSDLNLKIDSELLL